MASESHPIIPDSQVLMVTGKGGVGKTAVATALAAAYARSGKQTLLTVYEREDCDHPLLGEEAGYEPVECQPGLWLSRLDSRLSMKEYIHRTIPFHLLYDWLLSSKMLGQFTDAAPGFDELMCLGKLYDLAGGSDGKLPFDRIVFDAPATGHSALMLRTPDVTSDAIRTGPIHQSALKIQAMLENPQRFSVLVVALAEEMAVQEGQELLQYVSSELQLPTGPLIVNRTRQARFSGSEIEGLQAGSEAASPATRALVKDAVAFQRLCELQQSYIERIEGEYIEVPRVIRASFDADTIIGGMVASLQPAMGID